MGVERVGAYVIRIAIHALQQPLPKHGTPRRQEKGLEHQQLTPRQGKRFASDLELACFMVESQSPGNADLLRTDDRPARESPDAGHQLVNRRTAWPR